MEVVEAKRLRAVQNDEHLKMKAESSKRIGELESLLKESFLKSDCNRLASSIDDGLNKLVDAQIKSATSAAQTVAPVAEEETASSPKVRFSLGSDDEEEDEEPSELAKKEDPFDFNLSSSDTEDEKEKRPAELTAPESALPKLAEPKGSAESVKELKSLESSSEDSSDSSSSSSSSSSTSGSSSSSSSNSPEPVTRKPVPPPASAKPAPGFSFSMSDSEDETGKKSESVTKAGAEAERLEKARVELERLEKEKQDREEAARKAERERELQRVEEERLAKAKLEQEAQALDTWINKSIVQVLDSLVVDFMEETLTSMSVESVFLDFVVEKLINEVINPPASATLMLTPSKRGGALSSRAKASDCSVRSVVRQAVSEECDQVRLKIANEIVDSLVDGTVTNWMTECCERVITEYKIEICSSVRDELIEEHVTQSLMRSVILDVVFEENTLSPIIPIPESVKTPDKYIKQPKQDAKPAKPASIALGKPVPGVGCKDISPAVTVTTPGKRLRTIDQQPALISPSTAELNSPAKRTRVSPVRSEVGSVFSDEGRTRQSSPDTYVTAKAPARKPNYSRYGRHDATGAFEDRKSLLKLI